MSRVRLDMIIFGATGFTGKHTVKEANKFCKTKPFTWGVAGRNKEALEAVVKNFAHGAENVPIILADVKNEESLKEMTEQCKVLVNCCGPYRFFGEPLVRACIQTRTHHVDASGEPQYMERIQWEYNRAAKEAGVYILSACSFDSIPCDLGVIFAQKRFNGEVNSIETYMKFWSTIDVTGPVVNRGTWESAIYVLAHDNELRALRAKLFPEPLPHLTPKLKLKPAIHKSEVSEGWSIPFPTCDKSVADRTQRFLYEKNEQRPVQIETYMTMKSFMTVMRVAIVGAVFSLFTKTKCGRSLLLKYPRFFSSGYVSNDGPRIAIPENTHFSITFKASGWTGKLSKPTDKHVDPPNQEIITKVSGVNPAYGTTCTCLVLSALTILNESDKMPDEGGVFSPGAAFAETSIIDELNKNGVKFEVVSCTEK